VRPLFNDPLKNDKEVKLAYKVFEKELNEKAFEYASEKKREGKQLRLERKQQAKKNLQTLKNNKSKELDKEHKEYEMLKKAKEDTHIFLQNRQKELEKIREKSPDALQIVTPLELIQSELDKKRALMKEEYKKNNDWNTVKEHEINYIHSIAERPKIKSINPQRSLSHVADQKARLARRHSYSQLVKEKFVPAFTSKERKRVEASILKVQKNVLEAKNRRARYALSMSIALDEQKKRRENIKEINRTIESKKVVPVEIHQDPEYLENARKDYLKRRGIGETYLNELVNKRGMGKHRKTTSSLVTFKSLQGAPINYKKCDILKEEIGVYEEKGKELEIEALVMDDIGVSKMSKEIQSDLYYIKSLEAKFAFADSTREGKIVGKFIEPDRIYEEPLLPKKRDYKKAKFKIHFKRLNNSSHQGSNDSNGRIHPNNLDTQKEPETVDIQQQPETVDIQKLPPKPDSHSPNQELEEPPKTLDLNKESKAEPLNPQIS